MAIRSEKLRWGIRVSRSARQHYDLSTVREDGLLDGSTGPALDAAERMNLVHDVLMHPDQALRAAELSALVAIDSVFRALIERYELEVEPDAFSSFQPSASGAHERLIEHHLAHFTEEPGEALQDHILNGLIVTNSAAIRMQPLVRPYLDDANLESALVAHFAGLSPMSGRKTGLLELLREPQRAVPHSLQGQLEFIATNWQEFLGEELLLELLRSRDRLAEATKWSGPSGPPQSEVYVFDGADIERFSPDSDWMPSCVVIARNTYVWLHQLSRHYGRDIQTLSEIPDEEFELLSRRGISGLWLIGLWERSDASRRIKEMCGNPDAVASAYSLYDYRIADALGGEEGYQTLKEKAWRFGVRLAADMVPNHVGIVSDWVIHHPDWFVSLPNSPFPSYSFNGPDLCEHDAVSVHLEDHYFEKTDAAVVFKRYDHRSGEERYIYHGNDGTSMPWNDTAQLDYLNPEVREAVIQTILDVARRFPIIRFDAAMTLVNKHIQRLWYPEPGSGGAIPSRAEHGLTRDDFARRMQTEFWAEVVDRVAQEAPDTLLLAEAFWMLEGYFVRSLGMHRVYNSAFMNMLRDEKNDEYRQLMKNTLEFDPQILKRYVNFMNNPDEETAEAQFGKGDKYFGVCTMMATLPGLPMLGHGQIEGYTEKYGMDFRKPLRDELPDEGLVAYHEARIFPLLHRRRLFAEVDHFRLYDLYTSDGVDENVFAYSNSRDGERALVVYHNRFGDTAGWIRTSAAWAEKDGDDKKLSTTDLTHGLSLARESDIYYRFRDAISGLEFLRSAAAIASEGLFMQLHAYTCHVFLDWHELHDLDGRWKRLSEHLQGGGVDSLERAQLDMDYGHIYASFLTLLNASSDAARKAALVELFGYSGVSKKAGSKVPSLDDDQRSVREVVRDALLLLFPDAAVAREHFDIWGISHGLREQLDAFDPGLIRASLSLSSRGESVLNESLAWLRNADVRDALGVHEAGGNRWFRKEALEAFVERFPDLHGSGVADNVKELIKSIVAEIAAKASEVGYDFDRLVESLRVPMPGDASAEILPGEEESAASSGEAD